MKFSSIVFVLLNVLVCMLLAYNCPEGCIDVVPPEVPIQMKFTCAQYKKLGQCNEDYMDGYCLCSCGTCQDFLESLVFAPEPETEAIPL